MQCLLYREQRTPHFLDSSAIADVYICTHLYICIYILNIYTKGLYCRQKIKYGKIAKITIFLNKFLVSVDFKFK